MRCAGRSAAALVHAGLMLSGVMLAGVILAGCAARPAVAPPAAEPVITLAADALTFRGPILRGSYQSLLARVGKTPVHTLRISSGGGDVTSAIDIARWVHRNGVDVVVDGPCFSSCANYIFPAGREKHIVGDGIVGWHGTIEHLVYQQKRFAVLSPDLPMLEQTAAEERRFYADTGINGFISWFGKLAPYQVRNIYFLSADDMAYFGLEHLHVRDDYLRSDLARFNRHAPNTIVLLKVRRDVTNPSDPRWIAAPAAE